MWNFEPYRQGTVPSGGERWYLEAPVWAGGGAKLLFLTSLMWRDTFEIS